MTLVNLRLKICPEKFAPKQRPVDSTIMQELVAKKSATDTVLNDYLALARRKAEALAASTEETDNGDARTTT